MIPPGVGIAVTGASVQHIGASLCLNSDPPPLQSLPLAAILPLRWHHAIHTISNSLPNMARVTLVAQFFLNVIYIYINYFSWPFITKVIFSVLFFLCPGAIHICSHPTN